MRNLHRSHVHRTIFVGLAAIGLSACGEPQKPFKGTLTELIPTVKPSGMITCVAPVSGIPKTLSDALTTAVADELVDREYLALTRDTCRPQEPTLQATLQNVSADSITHTWSSSTFPDASYALTMTSRAEASQKQTIENWAKSIADALGYARPHKRSIRSPYQLPDGTSALLHDSTVNSASSNKKPSQAAEPSATSDKIAVYVKQGTGANGEGNLMLRYAMLGYLRRAGYEVTLDAHNKAPYQVQSKTVMAEPRITKDREKGDIHVQNVGITWTVTDIKGKRLGKLELANDLPAGLLPAAWRQAADIIAASSLNGIVQVIDRTEMARREALAQPTKP